MRNEILQQDKSFFGKNLPVHLTNFSIREQFVCDELLVQFNERVAICSFIDSFFVSFYLLHFHENFEDTGHYSDLLL